MRRSVLLAMIGLLLVAATAAWSTGVCTVVVNGRALDPGDALCEDGHTLLLAADALGEALGLGVTPPGEVGGPWTIRGFGRSVRVRADAAAFSADGETRQSDARPFVREGKLFVPLEMLSETFEVASSVQSDGGATVWALTTPGAAVTDIREGRHADHVRIVLDVDRPTGICWWSQPGLLTLELPALADGDGRASSVRLLRMEDELIDQVRQGPTATGSTRIEVLHFSPKPPQVFTLAEPPRIVVDLMRAPEDIWQEPEPEPVQPLPQAAGVLETRNFRTPRGNVRVFVIDVDPRSSAIEVRPALAASTVHDRASVTRIVRDSGAWGGVNGGFFARSGPPLGMLVINGEWVRDPWGGRTVLGITQDGKLLMDRLSFDGRAIFAGHGWQALAAINRGHEQQDTLVMFNRFWGGTVEGVRDRTRLAVDASGAVIAKVTDGSAVAIPRGGFVLSGIGRMAASLEQIELGCMVTLDLATTPKWPALAQAIGGGPRLVKDGKPHITAAPEGFRPDIYASAPSRTAVGITADGRLLLVAAEGAGEDQRCGMTLAELASTMIKLGARDAMNLDGGGSTTFVADGRLLNAPTDGAERRVSNALVVVTRVQAQAAADGG